MAFANDDLFQPPSVDFGSVTRPQNRYSDGIPVSSRLFGVPGGLAGSGLYGKASGLGATTQHANTELPAKLQAVKTLEGQLSSLFSQINIAVQQYASALEGTSQAGVVNMAQAAAQEIQSAIGSVQSVVPGLSQNYGSYQGSTDAWNAGDAAEQSARAVLQRYAGVPNQIASAGRAAITAAETAKANALAQQQANARAAEQANASALAQQQADQALVNGALTKATAFLGQGNYGGALAVIQAQDVVTAASRIGRAGDLDTAASAIAYQQRQAQEANDQRQAQINACSAKGGSWNGTYCDMSAATAAQNEQAQANANAKVDQALAQADAQASTGNWRAAQMILSGALQAANQVGRTTEIQIAIADVQQKQQDAKLAADRAAINAKVDAAISQAQTYAGNGAYDIALSVLNSVMSDATSIGRSGDVISAQGAITQARLGGTPSGGGATPTASDAFAIQRECMNAGGMWDGANCDMSEVYARRKQDQEQSRLMQLLPLFAGDPAIRNQILSRILGMDIAIPEAAQPSMASSVPGAAPQGISVGRNPYEGNFGDERF